MAQARVDGASWDAQAHLGGFLTEVVSQLGSDLSWISLFGSRARGDHRSRSDIDLLVVLREAGRRQRDVIHGAAVRGELEHNLDLSTRILSLDEFERLSAGPEPFWRNLSREERRLWLWQSKGMSPERTRD